MFSPIALCIFFLCALSGNLYVLSSLLANRNLVKSRNTIAHYLYSLESRAITSCAHAPVWLCARVCPRYVCARLPLCVCARACPLCVRLPPVWLRALACSLYVRVCPLCGCVRALATCMCAFACSYVCACACPCVCAFACSCLCARACPCVCAIAFPCVCARGLVPVCVCGALVSNILFFESGLNTVHLITLKNHNACFHIFMSSLQVIFMIQYINLSYVCFIDILSLY